MPRLSEKNNRQIYRIILSNICAFIIRNRKWIIVFYFILFFVFVFAKFDGSIWNIYDRAVFNRRLSLDIGYYSINLIPFKTICSFAERFEFAFHSFAFRYFFANTICYIPMGVVIPLNFIRIRKFWKTLSVCAVIII